MIWLETLDKKFLGLWRALEYQDLKISIGLSGAPVENVQSWIEFLIYWEARTNWNTKPNLMDKNCHKN